MSEASDAAQADELSDSLLKALTESWEQCRLAGDAAPYTVRPALTAEEVAELEAQLGGRLPAVIKASLLLSAGIDWKHGSQYAEYPWLMPGSAEVITGTDLKNLYGEVPLDVEDDARFVVVMRFTKPGDSSLLLGELSSGRLIRITSIDNLADPPETIVEAVGSGGWTNAVRALSVMRMELGWWRRGGSGDGRQAAARES